MSNSQNGWSVIPVGHTTETVPGTQPRARRYQLPLRGGKTLGIWLRDGYAGFILAYVIVFFDRWIEPVVGPTLDDWGYAIRDIRGSEEVSNHASATAADINALKHPLSAVGTFTLIQRIAIRRLLRKLSGVVKWGGDFNGRKDEMHWEIDAAQGGIMIASVAVRLAKTRRGKRILNANPGLRKMIHR